MDSTLEQLSDLSENVNKSDDARIVKEAQIEKDGEVWNKSELHAKGAPLIDPGVGEAVIIRQFTFKRNPEFKGTLTKQELFNMHWRQISNVLWGDGVVPLEHIDPRIEFGTRGEYTIFITCRARLGTFVAEKPETLNKLLAKKKKK